ncbi:hypothetical protein [Flavobacterium sp.]|uniref:hypothetical protein n=1 Tax=Flavobacterium sp. TaxID=239 RepID=UPI002B4AD7C7|nr:hypothetical protein [Flavobacterium sp.]HLP65868.1 hypothetical protein [Flavobacterium sp.]
MRKSKIYKILGVIVLLVGIGGGIYYAQLSNRHKAIVKTYLLHATGITDGNWVVESKVNTYKMISPSFYIDGIYKSMEGPKATNYVQLTTDSTLVWITSFEVKALDSKTKQHISNDFICHMNVDFNDVNYYTNLGLKDRIGSQYPRMTSLSHGLEKFELPKGYGIPMKGNDFLFVTTQSLNHNLPDENRTIKHEVSITYSKEKNIKPLMTRTIYIQLPYDKNDPFKEPLDPMSNQCIPVETKNHSYPDENGNMLSGHWVIPKGKKTYQSSVDKQLHIKDSMRLHAAAVHVHPFTSSITLFDVTANKVIFKSNVINHKNAIGLTKIDALSSEEGIWMYENHKYILTMDVNNTSNIQQDMMGSMFLFFYDEELDSKLK